MYKKGLIKFTILNPHIVSRHKINLIIYKMYNLGLILKETIREVFKDETYVYVKITNIKKLSDYLEKVQEMNKDRYLIKLEVGNDIEGYFKKCSCNNSDFYVLNPHFSHLFKSNGEPLLKCGNCGCYVNIIDLCDFNGDEYSYLNYLQELYNCIEYLRIGSLYNEFVINEMENVDSNYNVCLEFVRKILEDKINKPVYSVIKYPLDLNNSDFKMCPKCNKKLDDLDHILVEGIKKIDKVCNDCKILIESQIEI